MASLNPFEVISIAFLIILISFLLFINLMESIKIVGSIINGLGIPVLDFVFLKFPIPSKIISSIFFEEPKL